jgi:hypothetical protein
LSSFWFQISGKIYWVRTILSIAWLCTNQSKLTPLNVDISNTTAQDQFTQGLLHLKRKFSWPHFSITILGAGKYHDYVISHSETLKSKIFILEFYCEFGPGFFKIC